MAHLGYALPAPDHDVAVGEVQFEARFILGENAGLDGPDATGFGGCGQGPQQGRANPEAASFSRNVHRVFHDARVDGAG